MVKNVPNRRNTLYIYIYTQGVSSIRRVFKAAVRRDFQILAVSLGFLSNSGPNFANVAFGCFV